MIKHVVGWLRTEAKKERRRGHVARWIGRNWARVSYGRHIEPTWLELNQLTIEVADLPPAFAGFRIAQLTDFHCSRKVPAAYLNEAVHLAQAQNPDLVVLTGDFVHKGYHYVDRVARILGQMKGSAGVYAVLGNHDFSVRNALGIRRYRHLHRAVKQALTAQGIRVLENETVAVRRGQAVLHLSGVEDLWSRSCDLDRAMAGLCPSVPCIMLAHNPRTAERLNGRRCDLMLCGHTHGGQIKWPLRAQGELPQTGSPSPVADAPGPERTTHLTSRRSRRLTAGLYRFSQTQVYVNKGIGFGFRFRFGVRPEVAVFTLQRDEKNRAEHLHLAKTPL
jgi:predicted MPP superfamily phosphohydrolase